MCKFFGSKVVSANKSVSNQPSRRQAGSQRSNLTRPQPQWWDAKHREGLSVRTLTKEEVDEKLERNQLELVEGEKWWTVEYSKKYKSMTMAFLRTVMSGGKQYNGVFFFFRENYAYPDRSVDPDAFWLLIQKLSWHADTVLQLSEVYRHREG